MAEPTTPLPVGENKLNFAVGPIQVGASVLVQMNISDTLGLACGYTGPKEFMRALAKRILDSCDEAERQVIVPPNAGRIVRQA
jgi:hypothetical protein